MPAHSSVSTTTATTGRRESVGVATAVTEVAKRIEMLRVREVLLQANLKRACVLVKWPSFRAERRRRAIRLHERPLPRLTQLQTAGGAGSSTARAPRARSVRNDNQCAHSARNDGAQVARSASMREATRSASGST